MIDLVRLRSAQPNRGFHWFESLSSTMLTASELATHGSASGTIIGADEQLAGQGRYGRVWHSEPGAGLYISEILRLSLAPDHLPAITLALGLATADAISKTSGVLCDLRWPNDVLIEQKKCAGILVQLHDAAVIAGIGINVNHAAFPVELANTATSLRLATGREHSREDLLLNLLDAIDIHCDILAKDGREAILRLFSEHSSYVRGRRVLVDQGGAFLEGTTEGLDESGFLILRKPDGRRSLILAGGVRPAP